MKIGIVGRGFVGSAVEFGFSPNVGCDAEVRVHDKDPNKSLHPLEETVNQSDFIFVSVPTPANADGSINLDVVYQAFEDIARVNNRKDNVILLRSTVVPGTTRKISELNPNLNIVFNPEFLTERSAKFDFINQARFILGGDSKNTKMVADLYRWRFGKTTPIIETNFETSEIIKYMNNCYLATKVSFLNEMYKIGEKAGVDWDMAVEGFVRDGRIGHSHLSVPGPDGKLGFGGSCFPKDVRAMKAYAKELNVNSQVLDGVWNKNLEVRPEQDWKKLKGRSIVDEE